MQAWATTRAGPRSGAALASEPLALRLVAMRGKATDASIVLSASDGDNCNITTTECAGALTPEMVREAVREAAVGDALLVQGNLTEAATRAALEAADARGMVRVMNPSPLRPWQAEQLAACEAVFLNAAEAAALTGREGGEAARVLHGMGIAEVVVTRGAGGAFVSGPGGVAEVPAEPAAVRDTTGAGDAFLGATLASALLRRRAIDAVGQDARAPHPLSPAGTGSDRGSEVCPPVQLNQSRPSLLSTRNSTT